MGNNASLTFSIGTVCRMLNINEATLRLYERKGLITAKRDEHGYRSYQYDDLYQLTTIRHYRSFGLSMEQIKEILYAGDTDKQAALLEKAIAEKERLILDQRKILTLMQVEHSGLLKIHERKNVYEPVKLKPFAFLDLHDTQSLKEERVKRSIERVTKEAPAALHGMVFPVREKSPHPHVGYLLFDDQLLENASDFVIYPAQRYVRLLTALTDDGQNGEAGAHDFSSCLKAGRAHLEAEGLSVTNDVFAFRVSSEIREDVKTDYYFFNFPIGTNEPA